MSPLNYVLASKNNFSRYQRCHSVFQNRGDFQYFAKNQIEEANQLQVEKKDKNGQKFPIL